MKRLYMWCNNCQQVTCHTTKGCTKCPAQRPKPDKRVPNVFSKGRGF
jgi:hypothetical protein